MAAFDHKGRCLYASTPLASMLGYKLSVLGTKEISQLLPQPYGRLHMKWITVRRESWIAKDVIDRDVILKQGCCSGAMLVVVVVPLLSLFVD
jgi:hypothetical protein